MSPFKAIHITIFAIQLAILQKSILNGWKRTKTLLDPFPWLRMTVETLSRELSNCSNWRYFGHGYPRFFLLLGSKKKTDVLQDGVTAFKKCSNFLIFKDLREIFHSRPIPALYLKWFRSCSLSKWIVFC